MSKINTYFTELTEHVDNHAALNFNQKIVSFATIASDRLVEGEVLSSPQVCAFQSARDGISIHGYELSDEMNTLQVFAVDYHEGPVPSVISREEIKGLIQQTETFIFAAVSDLLGTIINQNKYPEIFDLSQTIKQNIGHIRHASIHIITNRISELDANPDDTMIENAKVTFHIWDLKKLYGFDVENVQMDELHIKLDEQFAEPMCLIEVPVENDTYSCYIGYVSGNLLAKAYEFYGNRLMERNVRSYLQARGKINKGIIMTAKKSPTMFMAYNNGLTTIAEQAVFSKKEVTGFVEISELIGWQIVNGGQTTASLYRAYKEGESLDELFVQIKLNVIKDMSRKDEIISSISEYANSQNKISISDLRSNDAYQAELERLSYAVTVPDTNPATKWFYERTRGQYMVEVNRQGSTSAKKRAYQVEFPKEQVITKTEAAKYIMSWNQYPNIVSKGSEANFLEFCNFVREDKIKPDENYYQDMIAKGILFRDTDKLIQTLNYKGYKANLVTYSIAALSLLNPKFDFKQIWAAQSISKEQKDEMEKIIEVVWDHITDPPVKGTNVTQYCKREACWTSLQHKLQRLAIMK
ncbi:AIPR family protein [Paenibacillus sp. GD4]|uniref:AIPR family protein n=1 Tax=Paenibacillus sp. GD4 TaxID=3068890 RepID=UPI0027968E14|nr:AIPR family protein [Paenibacillus sp. GD4]MDQ1910543.1 AIPR family protein [Paenibacillus sp. GD4]